jgi:hypothetical protein
VYVSVYAESALISYCRKSYFVGTHAEHSMKNKIMLCFS